MAKTDTVRSSDTARVVAWRAKVLCAAGYPAVAAFELAERADVDLHEAVALLRRDCPVETALRILR